MILSAVSGLGKVQTLNNIIYHGHLEFPFSVQLSLQTMQLLFGVLNRSVQRNMDPSCTVDILKIIRIHYACLGVCNVDPREIGFDSKPEECMYKEANILNNLITLNRNELISKEAISTFALGSKVLLPRIEEKIVLHGKNCHL